MLADDARDDSARDAAGLRDATDKLAEWLGICITKGISENGTGTHSYIDLTRMQERDGRIGGRVRLSRREELGMDTF
jgi:hypothetical protein